MAEDLYLSPEMASELISKIGYLGNWLQAIGIIAILWIIFQIANWAINKKRLGEVYKIKEDMVRIENKIDKIVKKK